jgi:hypothetical protein
LDAGNHSAGPPCADFHCNISNPKFAKLLPKKWRTWARQPDEVVSDGAERCLALMSDFSSDADPEVAVVSVVFQFDAVAK